MKSPMSWGLRGYLLPVNLGGSRGLKFSPIIALKSNQRHCRIGVK